MKTSYLMALLGTGLFATLMVSSMVGCESHPVYVDCEEEDSPQPNGLYVCGPLLARRDPVTCVDQKGTGQCALGEGCQSDADCPGANGRCDARSEDDGGGCGCTVGCSSDADCGAKEVCLCTDDAGGRCVPAECKTDADCGEGNECVLYQATEVCTTARHPGFACTTNHDLCLSDDTCGGNVCFNAGDHFACGNTQCDA